MNVRRIVLMLVVLLGLTALAVAVAAPMVFRSEVHKLTGTDDSEGRPIEAMAGY